MLPDLKSYLEAQQAPLKAALMALVRIPSICDEGAGGYPFGEEVDHVLRKALEIAAELGFRTHYDEEGYFGWAESGEGDVALGVLGHLDVVPPGRLEDWQHDPFDPVEKDGMLYGRGTQDDKGGVLAALFAAKALLDAGVRLGKRVRFIFGTDEESLWRCIRRYKEREELPELGFSPDARFPLIHAEKGLLQAQLVGRRDGGKMSVGPETLRLQGGSAFNAVPDSIIYSGTDERELARELDVLGFAYSDTPAGIEVHGKAAHAMIAEQGVNAIARLCIALDHLGSESGAVRFVAQQVGEDASATRIFGAVADGPSGKLTFNVGKINIDHAGGIATETLSVDCRIPVTIAKQEVVAKLMDAARKYGLEYKEFDWLEPLYVPLDHRLIQTLMRVYRQVTGDSASQPFASGGATYARSMPNCVAFGALLRDEVLTEHMSNERVAMANLYEAMEIYAHAIYELSR